MMTSSQFEHNFDLTHDCGMPPFCKDTLQKEKKVDELDTVGAVTSQVEIVVAYSHFFSPKLFCPLIALFFSLLNCTIFHS